MSLRELAFAYPILPKCCEARFKTEPKRNIVGVFKDDFSSKIEQAAYWQTLRAVRCNASARCNRPSSGFFKLDVIVEPLRRIRQGADVMWFTFRDADQRDKQKHKRRYFE